MAAAGLRMCEGCRDRHVEVDEQATDARVRIILPRSCGCGLIGEEAALTLHAEPLRPRLPSALLAASLLSLPPIVTAHTGPQVVSRSSRKGTKGRQARKQKKKKERSAKRSGRRRR